MKSLSLRTQLYLYTTYLIGFAIFVLEIRSMDISKPWLLVGLCVLASLALILKVEGSTKRSHYTFSFLIYGFTFAIYGAEDAILIIAVSNLVEWIWNKPPWYIQLFNTSSYILVMAIAGAIASLINPENNPNTWQTALALIVGMAIFNILNHLMVAIVVWLARGENFKESGIFDFFPLMLDQSLLYFGASLSIVWNYNPFALGLIVIPLYLIYSTLRVPALERQTEIDSKTGLFNHQYFKKHLENELTRSNRFDRPLAVILADLDLLRNINNTYGHLAGDDVLIGMAKAMKASVRDYDIVCRFGGEEFAILLPETTLLQAYERAEVIRKAIESIEFTVPTSITPIRATMSFGVAHRENFSQSPEQITHNADLALYHSKLSGRNRTFAYQNEEYIDFQANKENTRSSQLPTLPEKHLEPVAQTSSYYQESTPTDVETVKVSTTTNPVGKKEQPSSQKTKSSNQKVYIFISLLASLSIGLYMTILPRSPLLGNMITFDWLGLIVIIIMIALSEAFSLDLYFKQSSLSTSAIPILVTYLIFGSIGTLLASIVLAVSLVIKYRSAFNRFVFNFSTHLLSGTLTVGVGLLAGNDILNQTPIVQLVFSIIAAVILYSVTSTMVSYGMSLELKQPALQIWKEQYRWLAPYYLGIGVITYSLIFGYNHDHVTGILLMTIPMVLLRISQKQYIDRTREIVTELRDKNQILKRNSDEINELNEGLLITLSEIIDIRDPYVLGHSKQVSNYSVMIAKSMGLNEKQVELIRKAGLLHDIGKLGIAMEILSKPGKLTPEEYEKIKEHSALGGDLVKNSPSLRSLFPIIRHHHEYFNGKGYPDNLAGNQISIEARIVSVADAIEAMASDRPYRKALKLERIMDELTKNSGSQFDPTVVKSAIEILEKVQKNESIAPSQAANPQSHVEKRWALQTSQSV